MKAYILHGIGDLRCEEAMVPQPDAESALIEVMAAGICGSDIPRIYQTGTYHFPMIPGHEFSGIVRQVGNKKNQEWIGKRVAVFPLIPCKTCQSCKAEYYEMCEHYDYLGSRTDGGFAEYTAAPIWNLIELPENVTYEEAAMLEPIAVALHAIKQVSDITGKTVAIFGVGAIGLSIAQWARLFGATKVLLIVNKQEQIEVAQKLQFRDNCNSAMTDSVEWILSETAGTGADIVIDGVGSSEVLGYCLEAVSNQGTIVAVGNPKEDVRLDQNTYWKFLRKQLRMYGTWNSRFGMKENNDWQQALLALERGEIESRILITHRLTFEELPKGLNIMKDKKEFYCKVMICMKK